ncbi:hypothetical protein [Pseudoalteromonas spongiae]|uniref:hypothetical protein n=1 Tax=Pseudoalteromonas spongiae TaxID=298657 RepID=UPI000C2D1CBC|nr:hypothetical protein [Pseudoalteromonas spongiae]
MSKFRRFLYILEFVLAFGPSLAVLTIGVLFSPAFLLSMYDGGWSNILIALLIVLGLLGLWGGISLIGLTLNPEQENTKPARLKVYVIAGLIASTSASIFAGTINLYLLPVFIAPLLVTLHLVIKQRSYFSASATNTYEPSPVK